MFLINNCMAVLSYHIQMSTNVRLTTVDAVLTLNAPIRMEALAAAAGPVTMETDLPASVK